MTHSQLTFIFEILFLLPFELCFTSV
jgi:hypothetical protein